ncbi:MAG: sugar ABC transporter substrate-binding protein, partial [Candidatus Aenigmarchaeota archaeon]|nr:sugar ABC transporter substrate-binding protein [Candidatus Aenigmarchaeota archaeon]
LNLIQLVNFANSIVCAQEPQNQPRVDPVDAPKNYIIGKGDVLRVFVWRNEQLSSEVVVRPDGKISLPLLQDLQAEGLTVLQLKEEITRKFSE